MLLISPMSWANCRIFKGTLKFFPLFQVLKHGFSGPPPFGGLMWYGFSKGKGMFVLGKGLLILQDLWKMLLLLYKFHVLLIFFSFLCTNAKEITCYICFLLGKFQKENKTCVSLSMLVTHLKTVSHQPTKKWYDIKKEITTSKDF